MAQVLTKNVVSILFMYWNIILFHCKQLTLDVPSIHVPECCLFEFQYNFYHVSEYCKIIRMQSQIYCTFFYKSLVAQPPFWKSRCCHISSLETQGYMLEISRKPAKKFQTWGWLNKRINKYDLLNRTLLNFASDEKLSAYNLKIRQWLLLCYILLDIACGNILNQYVQPASCSF